MSESQAESPNGTPNGSPEARVAVVSIDALTPDQANARRHPERNRATVTASLRQFGAGRSIVLDGKDVIRAGNQTVESAREAGFREVIVVEPGPNQLVAVKRSDWTATEATAYGLVDNRAAEQAEWIPDVLGETLEALRAEEFDLGAIGFDDGEVDALIAGMANEAMDGEKVTDPAAEWQGMPEFEHEDLTAGAAFTIRVFLKDADDLAAFGQLLGKDLTGHKFVWFSKQPISETYEVHDGP